MSEVELLAHEWLDYASEDLAAAEAHHAAKELAPRITCWFAQQAAEKAIKSLLVLDQIEFPFTHDLVRAHELVRQPLEAASRHDLRRLSAYAVQGRYPGAWPELTREDAVAALVAAREILDEVRRRFGGEAS